MSIIAAGTTSTTGLVQTSDTTGNLVLQVNGTTPSLTLNTAGAHGVGSSPSYGTSGQVLTSAGSAASPTWTTPSSGAMTLISTKSNSGGYTNFTSLSGYDKYYILFTNIDQGSTTFLTMLFGYGSTPTYLTSGYSYEAIRASSTSVSSLGSSGGGSYAYLAYFPSTISLTVSGSCFITGFTSSTNISATSNFQLSNSMGGVVGSYIPSGGVPMTAIQIGFGSTVGGTVSLYGISS